MSDVHAQLKLLNKKDLKFQLAYQIVLGMETSPRLLERVSVNQQDDQATSLFKREDQTV